MPMIVSWMALTKYTTPEQGKLQLGAYFRSFNRVRDPEQIDNLVRMNYERLYNIQQIDVIGIPVLDFIAPQHRENISRSQGFSFLEDKKKEGKSEFLDSFLKSKKKPQF